jgi:hypothetical protein
MPRSCFALGRLLAVALLAASVLSHSGCGSSSVSPPPPGALSGNWQFNLIKNNPFQQEQLFASGFLQQSNGDLTGSVQGPTTTAVSGTVTCGGIGPLAGSISGQNINFTLDPGGTTINFTGTVSIDQKLMSGSYAALGGACYDYPTSGTWTASLVPALNGSFKGTLNSNYMAALTGSANPVPVSVSGSFTQTPNAGGSTASLTGTISAVGYPCFTTASLTGTISGQNIYLSVYGYNGLQIGSIGQAQLPGGALTPAILTVTSTGLVVTGPNSTSGFNLNLGNPCPAVINPNNGKTQTTDFGGFTLNLE